MAKPGYTTEQTAELINAQMKPFLGTEELLSADLSNIVDFGKAYDKLTDDQRNIVTSGLIALVTDQYFEYDEFIGDDVNIIRSFNTANGNGGIIQLNYMDSIDAVDDPSFNPDAYSTNDNFVNIPQKLRTVYFENDNAAMFEISIPENWYKGYLKSAEALNSMISMIQSNLRKSIAIHMSIVTKDVVNARAAATLHKNDPNQSINILKEFNDTQRPDNPIRVSEMSTDADFARYLAMRLDNIVDMMSDYNVLLNLSGRESATRKSDIHVLANANCISAIDKYLMADVRNLEFMSLPNYRKVFKWQGVGTDANFKTLSTINVEIDVPWEADTVKIDQSYVLFMIYNPKAMGIYDLKINTKSQADAIGNKVNHYTHLNYSTMNNPLEDMAVVYADDSYLDVVETVAAKKTATK